MAVECQGKQGAAVYVWNPTWYDTNGNLAGYLPSVNIYAPSRDLNNPPKWGLGENKNNAAFIMLFESTPLNITRSTTTPDGFATWFVYTQAGGIEGYRGVRGKLNSQSFIVVNTWNSKTKVYNSHLALNTSPSGKIQSWNHSKPSYINRVVFSHGEQPVTTHHLNIVSAEGFSAYNFSKPGSELSYSVHCGCDYNKCQKGTFPLKYCCFDCTDVNRWLRQIRDYSAQTKFDIKQKLGIV